MIVDQEVVGSSPTSRPNILSSASALMSAFRRASQSGFYLPISSSTSSQCRQDHLRSFWRCDWSFSRLFQNRAKEPMKAGRSLFAPGIDYLFCDGLILFPPFAGRICVDICPPIHRVRLATRCYSRAAVQSYRLSDNSLKRSPSFSGTRSNLSSRI